MEDKINSEKDHNTIKDNNTIRNDIYSRVLRSGNRTYFFDVKKTRAGEYYLSITESKKYFSEQGSVLYKKYKIHLYKDDFYKFQEFTNETISFIIDKNEK